MARFGSAACFGVSLPVALVIHCNSGSLQQQEWPEGGWARHTIDDSSLGADCVRLADINGDGHLDIASPWEQGGQVRVYLNPGPGYVKKRWPAITVGEVGDPEDAFFADMDGDGRLDVVSSCEGDTRTMYVHWAPAEEDRIRDSSAWVTEELPPASGMTSWMYADAVQLDQRAGIDLVAGSKGEGAAIGWFRSPGNPRNLSDWTWFPLYAAGWVMTVRPNDMDADGDLDLVATDRKGSRRGALWLEHPGPSKVGTEEWTEHRIGPLGEHEAMHNAIADLDGDGLDDVLVAVKGGPLRFHRRVGRNAVAWQTHLIEMPAGTGSGKSVQAADIDLDGQMDLVVACEHASEGRIGVFWLVHSDGPTKGQWSATSISGPEGFIYDLIELTDLDSDGDLDVITLEEKGPYLADGFQGVELGVIWYENPAR